MNTFTQSLQDSLFIASIFIAALFIICTVSLALRNYEIRHELKKLKKWRKFSEIEKAQKHEEYDRLATELVEERAFNDTQGSMHVRLMLKYAHVQEESEKLKSEAKTNDAKIKFLESCNSDLIKMSTRRRNEKGQFIKKSDRDWTTATKEELLAEAKRRYPVGTKFVGVCTNKEEICEMEAYFYWLPENYIAVKKYAGVVYRLGKWAEIIPNA